MAERNQTRVRPGRAPHRRSDEARIAVLHATDDLLAERGYRGLTIEGIATRAGVAKQTIYRWWPSKIDILLDVLQDDAGAIEVPATGSTIADVRDHLRKLARFLTKDPAGRVLLTLLGESQQDPAVAEIFAERWQKAQRKAERDLLRRVAGSGEIEDPIDPEATLDALYGPVYYRAMTGRPVTRGFVDGLVVRILTGPR